MTDDRLEELLEELVIGTERGDHDVLDRLVADNPDYEHQLTAFALSYAGNTAPPSSAELAEIEALITPSVRRRALDAASGRVPRGARIAGIFVQAGLCGLDARQLAAAVDLPRDVVLKLDRRLVAVQSIPQRCLQRLADALQTSTTAVLTFLGGGPAPRVAAFNYAAAPPEVVMQDTFAAALAASTLATAEQRAAWQQTLRDEGLA